MSKLLVVFGATGNQGRSVVNAVLNDSELSKQYKIRGTSRDPTSDAAQALVKQGVEMVAASNDDSTSLINAFTGADTVFAYTVSVYEGDVYGVDIRYGRALADAVVAAKVPQYIWSSMPNARKISGGTYKNMGHFDSKEDTEQYIRTLPVKSAFVAPAGFMSNYHGLTRPRPSPAGDGTFVIAGPAAGSTLAPLIDIEDDYGKWVAAILADFDKYEGVHWSMASEFKTHDEIAQQLSKHTGKTVKYQQLPADVYGSFLPENVRANMVEMWLFMQDYGYFGPNMVQEVKEAASHARGNLTSFDKYLESHPLSL